MTATASQPRRVESLSLRCTIEERRLLEILARHSFEPICTTAWRAFRLGLQQLERESGLASFT